MHLANGEDELVMCYVSDLLQRLGLTEWTVLISDKPTQVDKGAEPGEQPPSAQIDTEGQRYLAVLQLGPRWGAFSDDLKRETLVHEVLHLMTRNLHARGCFWSRTLPTELITHAYMDLNSEEELFVDRMATVLAPLLPQYPGSLSVPIPTVRRERDWC